MATTTTYSRAQVAMHWITLILLAGSFFSHDAMKAAWRAVSRGNEVVGSTHFIHIGLGVAVLLLTLLRLTIRHKRGAPVAPSAGNPVFDLLGKLTHWGIYALLIVLPLTGMGAWGGGVHALGDVHELFFTLLIVLVGLHFVAAIYHHFVLKDGLLTRMRWPK